MTSLIPIYAPTSECFAERGSTNPRNRRRERRRRKNDSPSHIAYLNPPNGKDKLKRTQTNSDDRLAKRAKAGPSFLDDRPAVRRSAQKKVLVTRRLVEGVPSRGLEVRSGPFARDLPKLSVGFKGLDIAAGASVRAVCYTTDIDNRSEFSTLDDHSWENPRLQTKRRIDFERPFVTPPKVVVYLKGIDAGNGSSVSVCTYVTNIDVEGFTMHIDTWVFVALNSVNISFSTNFKINAFESNVSTTGFTRHLDSWADMILYSAGISYIALN
ncbi:hypothetical protein K438DRAFT_1956083 [Mycena galopus ATCC 62051]|nr:hypothetical protein K438DRAFT_1956083 [Mycena galopus ATCC 62051]